MKRTFEAAQPPRCPRGEKGFILGVTLFTMLLLSALGAALLTLSSTEVVQARISQNRLQAFTLAEAGETYARRALSLDMDLDANGVTDQTQVFTNNQPVNWDSTVQLAALEPGASGSVTIVRHAGDPDLAIITSTARLGYATRTIEVMVRRAIAIPPGVKGSVTARGPVATNGSLTVDGRDHTINGNLILNSGTFGVFTASTYAQGGSSKVGGTDPAGTDFQPAKPGDPSVIKENVTDTLPSTPDELMGGTANGFPEGQLKWMAQGGIDGSQYVTDPANLTFPLSGVTYVELPAVPPGVAGVDNVWTGANLGNGTGILIVHNATGNAVLKNTTSSGKSCGCFRGLVIADDIVHVHTTITGAVVSLTTGPSSGNVLGNGNGKILFSRAALQQATGSLVQRVWPIYSWREVK